MECKNSFFFGKKIKKISYTIGNHLQEKLTYLGREALQLEEKVSKDPENNHLIVMEKLTEKIEKGSSTPRNTVIQISFLNKKNSKNSKNVK